MQIEIDSIFSFHQIGQRDNQEDSRFPDKDAPETSNCTFAVCDGVGGCEKGETASSTVCSHIAKFSASHKQQTEFTELQFKQLLSECYDALDKASSADNIGMGTTLTFVTFHSGGCFAAHIGDSRIYQIRPSDGIMYRSEDHSLINSLLRSGNIGPDDAKNHPKNNVITRCMSANDGVRDRDDATVVTLTDIIPGDYFLLCSDGVVNSIDDDSLIELLSSEKSDNEKICQLSKICSSSLDNNTAILIHIGDVTVDPVLEDVDNEEISINTKKLRHRDDTAHDVAADKSNTTSKLKSLINKIFK